MNIMHTKSQRFIAIRFETTGSDERKLCANMRMMIQRENEMKVDAISRISYLFVVVQKLSIVVTPIMTRAGTAFTSSQKEMKELVTRTIPGTKTVVK